MSDTLRASWTRDMVTPALSGIVGVVSTNVELLLSASCGTHRHMSICSPSLVVGQERGDGAEGHRDVLQPYRRRRARRGRGRGAGHGLQGAGRSGAAAVAVD